ncbi:hypothetical protein ASPBRDRAFT_662808 [Aspergillus brasiliensis CBS 101740]|uniref:Aminoglycoside phosphotransferase domain-containing protein n=1 Tax=Aspergillus brasiliensis (strain CBS 101740 / IMI 381727 / IBT 21946) TaxID=767769 RepID=A0A1L9U528_ASPBC|nr:hypothetical protein ASPBRDRAFT_662808 [Aspergillus brasiliensis CBS 101740]
MESPTHGDVAKLLEKLPSLISDAHHADIWGIQLDGDDEKGKEIVVRKFLEQHSIIPSIRLARASASLKSALEWRRIVKPRAALMEAREILTNTGLQNITRTENRLFMWIVIDEKTIRDLSACYERFMHKYGLSELGTATLEQFASAFLDAHGELDGEHNLQTACVVRFKLLPVPPARKFGIPLRTSIRDMLSRIATELQEYYPGLLDRFYLIQPFDDYLDSMKIPESFLRKTTILQAAEDLVNYLGPDIPPEYGDMSLCNYDLIEHVCGEHGDPHAARDPLKIKPTHACDNTKEDTNLRAQKDDTDSKVSSAEPELTWSETIGPPTIILDPEDLKTARELCPGKGGARLAWADSQTIVKYGHGVRLAEAEAMHCTYILHGVCYIVMEYVEAESFDKYWDRVSEPERENVLRQLRNYVSQMRSIKGDFIGGVDSSRCRDGIFDAVWDNYGAGSYGPYASEDLFTEGIVQALQDRIPPNLPEGPSDLDSVFFTDEYVLYQTVRELKKINHSIVFTHGDLHYGNMLVRSDGTVVIVDWGLAGYWPDYWEFYRAMFQNPWRPSWDRMVEKFVPPSYIEYYIMKKVFAYMFN